VRRSIGIVTTSRADYGIYQSLLRRIHADPTLELRVFVSGMHLSPEFGATVHDIERDGFPITARVEMLLSSDTPQAISKAIGIGVLGFAQALEHNRPDMLVLLGDRFDMFAAAVAAVPFGLPLVHIHGGEITEAAIDDVLRHAMTKMSHLHFPTTLAYANRLIQMGEEPWRITVAGAPALDNLEEANPGENEVAAAVHLDAEALAQALLVTYHPVTLESGDAALQIGNLLDALRSTGRTVIFTFPNADTGGRALVHRIRDFSNTYPHARVVANLGRTLYFGLMRRVAAMAGNSSSGVIEAASFELPVVNVGNRQRGRLRSCNVIDCGYGREDITRALERALSPEFRHSLRGLVNPYGDGHAAERIVQVLKQATLGEALLKKLFCDHELPIAAAQAN